MRHFFGTCVLLAALAASSAPAAITSTGSVNPTAPTSWTASTSGYIGYTGAGTLTVNGGSVLDSSTGTVGNSNGGTGSVTIDGFGSTWTNGGAVYVGAGGSGTVAITNGGALSDTVGTISEYANSTGAVTVDGAGSKWTSTSSLFVGNYGSGTLNISGGGAVMATSVAVSPMDYGPSLLAIDVGRGSSLTVGAGSGAMSNNGTVRILAAQGSGGQHVFTHSRRNVERKRGLSGGRRDLEHKRHAFTVSPAVSGAAGTPVSLDPSQKQRLLITDAGTSQWLGASFWRRPAPRRSA